MTLGYDPEQKSFVGTWIDSETAYLWTFTGQLDAAKENREAQTAIAQALSQRRQDAMNLEKLRLSGESQAFDQMVQMRELMMSMAEQQREQREALNDALKVQADTLKAIREATGADAVISPMSALAYQNQEEILIGTQETIP